LDDFVEGYNVSNNVIFEARDTDMIAGIMCENSKDGIIANNVFNANDEAMSYGVYLSGVSGTQVVNNVFYGCVTGVCEVSTCYTMTYA